MENKVSVIIPIYNSEDFLDESLNSIINQTYSNIEIICVDDGSTDKSSTILKQFADKITILTQNNRGLASALNLGISKMSGNWFKWFSPDDILYPFAIEILLRKAIELGGDRIVYSNWELIDEKNNHLRNFSETNYNDLEKIDFNVRLLDGQQINVNTSLIPSWLFEKKCLFQDLKDPVIIDYDFFLRAGILFDVGFYLIPQILLKYRIHANQLSHRKILKSMSNTSAVKKNILLQIDESKRNLYHNRMQTFRKKKSIHKKTMEFGLKFMKNTLPNEISDKILIYYLNKIRRSR